MLFLCGYKIFYLYFAMMTETTGQILGSKLERVLEVHVEATMMNKDHHFLLRVELSVEKPLLRKLLIKPKGDKEARGMISSMNGCLTFVFSATAWAM